MATQTQSTSPPNVPSTSSKTAWRSASAPARPPRCLSVSSAPGSSRDCASAASPPPTPATTSALALGIPLTNFDDTPSLDVAVDGADEVAPGLALIKGGGGALLREKIVISAARSFVVVADSSKAVEHLGAFPLPVEVIQMALPIVSRRLTALNLHPTLRKHPDGSDYVTDEGNLILDCHCGPILDPEALAASIRAIVGVVEHGLFLHMATTALIAGDHGVIERTT